MSSVPAVNGFWIFHDRGYVLGSYYTLNGLAAYYLSAALPVIVRMTGNRSWTIIATMLHQFFAPNAPHNGLRHSILVSLRNPASELSTLWELWRMWRAWRRPIHLKPPFYPLIVIAVIAAVHFSAWTYAAIASHYIWSSTHNFVRVAELQPGYILENTSGHIANFETYIRSHANAAQAVARACYNTTSNRGLVGCQSYVTPVIDYQTYLSPCPVDPSVCLLDGASASMSFDTGAMDSAEVFGIASSKKNRVTYRKVTSCAPLSLKDYSALVNGTQVEEVGFGHVVPYFPGDSFLRVYAGDLYGYFNFTYEWNTHAKYDGYGYQLSAFFSDAGFASGWNPIPALNRTDADVTLIFIAPNSITYTSKVDDPVFLATDFDEETSAYYPNFVVTSLVCVEQHELCNPNNMNCTGLLGIEGLQQVFNLDTIGLNLDQISTAFRFINPETQNSVYDILTASGSEALQLQLTVDAAVQLSPGMPSNQWQIETEGWWQTTLANLQAYVVEYARKDTPINIGRVESPVEKYDVYMASHQIVIGSAEYTTFSVFGIAFTGFFSLVVIGLSMFPEKIIFSLYKTRFFGHDGQPAKERQYHVDGKFQLGRLVYQGRHWGNWQRHTEMVPVTSGEIDLPLAEEDQEVGEGGGLVKYYSIPENPNVELVDVQNVEEEAEHVEQGGAGDAIMPNREVVERQGSGARLFG